MCWMGCKCTCSVPMRVCSTHVWTFCMKVEEQVQTRPTSSVGQPRQVGAVQWWPMTGDNMAEVSMNQRLHLLRSTGSFLTNAAHLRRGGAARVPLHMGAPRSISRLSPFMGHRRVPLTDGAFVETSRGLSAGASPDARISQHLSWVHLSVLTNGAPFPLPQWGRMALRPFSELSRVSLLPFWGRPQLDLSVPLWCKRAGTWEFNPSRALLTCPAPPAPLGPPGSPGPRLLSCQPPSACRWQREPPATLC